MQNNRKRNTMRKLNVPGYLKEKLQENYRNDILFSASEVARRIGISLQTFHKWRRNGNGPNFVLINGVYYYYKKDLLQWIESKKVHTTG